jgi:drug/metabolite transporter (DMT)-like permease
MSHGSGPLIRYALAGATPRQRYVIGIAMIAVGVVLVMLGHFAGGLLAVAGVFLLWRMVQSRVHRGPRTPGSPQGPEGR